MNDNEPLNVGDRVKLREYPEQTGTIWDVSELHNMVIVQWDSADPEENVYVREPRRWLEKITG